MGAFQQVMPYETIMPERTFFYKPKQKNYKDLGEDIGAIIQEAKSIVEVNQSFGISAGFMGFYYDNPNWMAEGNPRSDIGFYMYNPSLALIQTMVEKNYGVMKFPPTRVIQVHLPWKNMLSIFLVIFKAYGPLVEKMLEPEYASFFEHDSNPFIEHCLGNWYYVSCPIEKNTNIYRLTTYPSPKINEEGEKWIADHRAPKMVTPN